MSGDVTRDPAPSPTGVARTRGQAEARIGPAWMVLALACTCQFMVILDASIVNVALPSVDRDLGFTATGLAWVRDWLAGVHDGAVPIGDVARIASTLSHPNVAAVLLELSLPLLVAWMLTAERHWRWPTLPRRDRSDLRGRLRAGHGRHGLRPALLSRRCGAAAPVPEPGDHRQLKQGID